MYKLVAIGGGEIGKEEHPIETTHIDAEIIKLSGKPKPNILFIPTASNDNSLYIKMAKKHFQQHFGCHVDVLKLYDNPPNQVIKKAILQTDVIYVGGGNTLKMMTKWRKLGIDILLEEAARQGKVLTGLSAGAICWFKGGLSDSRKFTSKGGSWNFAMVRGLNFYDFYICPHFSSETKRKQALKNRLKNTNMVAIALDDCVAIEIVDDEYRIIGATKDRGAYKTYWHDGRYFVDPLHSKDYKPLKDITSIR